LLAGVPDFYREVRERFKVYENKFFSSKPAVDHASCSVIFDTPTITLPSGCEPLANSKARSRRTLTMEEVLALVA
jgi:hypothetical protein